MLRYVTIEQLRNHCRVDSDAGEDELLGIYGAAAEKHCENAINRRIFATQGELDAARAQLADGYAALVAGVTDDPAIAELWSASVRIKRAELRGILHGIVADSVIMSATLLLAGRLYRNRETNAVDQGEVLTPLALGHDELLQPYKLPPYWD